MRNRFKIPTHSLIRQPSVTFTTLGVVLHYRSKSTVHET